MPLQAPLVLRDWFRDSVEDFMSIAPTSTSPQPVHVLTGFFHNAFIGRRAPRVAIDLVATKGGGWARSNRELRERGAVQYPTDDYELSRVRHAVAGLVASDRAVFVSAASFQLAHLGLITGDATHHRLGALAARLALEVGDAEQDLLLLAQRLALPQPNPHWALEALLSEPGAIDDLACKDPLGTDWWGRDPRCAEFAQNTAGLLSRVLKLGAGSVDSLLALQTLAIAATWSGLLAFAQVPALLLGKPKIPILCEAGAPGALPTLRSASAGALIATNSSFEEWLATRLEEELRARFGDHQPTPAEAHEVLREARAFTLSGGSTRSHQRLPDIYDLFSVDAPSSQRAMALALRDGLITGMGDKPKKWFGAVGRHCGFVGPRRGYPARFRVEVSLVPSLVLAGIATDDGPTVRFSEWLERLRARFGLHFGPDPVCRQMLPRASEDDLERNLANLSDLLSSLGLARRYSDGVTEVLNPLELWRRQ